MGIMREYKKPVMKVERFVADTSFAATGCTSQSSSSSTYEQQLITCIIDGSEYVFYSECKNNVSSGYIGTYNGQPYFVWYDGIVGSQPSDDEVATLTAIEYAVMGDDAYLAVGNHGWHAGIASATITTIWNSSY